MSDWKEYSRELAARRIERRTLLKGAFALGTLAALESSKLAKAVVGPPRECDPRKIESIVVTMMENRSLDHYLGWMGPSINGRRDLEYPTTLVDGNGNPIGKSCAPGQDSNHPAQYAGDGPTMKPYHLRNVDGSQKHCLATDPDHGWDASRIEFNGGDNLGFYYANYLAGGVQQATDSLGYYDADDIPVLAYLAQNYTTFANYFSSVMGPTYPNRLYWLSGQGGGFKGNTIPGPYVGGGFPPAAYTDGDHEPDGHDWATIFHQLDAAGIPWTYYHTDLATVMLFFNRVEENPGKVRFITDYYADAAAGVLTPVVFLDPGFTVIGNDDHPARDIKFGQRYIYDAFCAVAEGPQWYNPRSGKGSVFVVNYDEAGGFFDHVPPPRAAGDPNPSSDHCEDWSRMGFRVPCVVASPFSRGADHGGPTGLVDQRLFDHTSVIKLIQDVFLNGQRLNDFAWQNGLPIWGKAGNGNGLNYGSRDADPNIGSLLDVLDTSTARPEVPAGLPASFPVHAQGLWCAQSQATDYSGGDNPLEGTPDPDLPPLARPGVPQPEIPHKEWAELADRGFFGKYDFRERARHGVLRD